MNEPVKSKVPEHVWLAEAEAGGMFGRSVAAILLLIGFYILALAAVAVCFAIAYLDLTTGSRIHPKLVAVTATFGVLILWSIMPRFDRFQVPGLELRESEHPELFRTIREVAQGTGETMPRNIYLVNDLNAWVTHRGGIMGIGSKRVMGLGLPLMQGLTVSEFKAVVAHEFGHFSGGDVALGPWIYKTREAIGRTVNSLKGDDDESYLAKPFQLYGEMFIKITRKISRSQEYCADAVACKTVGAMHLVSGLTKLGGLTAAWDAYFSQEVQPILNSGIHPPVAHGFATFMKQPHVAEGMGLVSEGAFAETEAHPYDTHPPTAFRVAAAGRFPKNMGKSDARPAASLLRDIDKTSQALIDFVLKANGHEGFKPMSWEDVGSKVYLPYWREKLKDQASSLQETPLRSYPNLAQDLWPFLSKIRFESNALSKEDREGYVCWILGVALGVALCDQGWQASAIPGEPLQVIREGEALNFTQVLDDLASGAMTEVQFQELLHQNGLANKHAWEPLENEAPRVRRMF